MMVLAIDGIEPEKADTTRFPDVPKGAWYINYVARAAELKLIDGYTDGTFRPEANVSKEEMLTIIVRALGYRTAVEKMDGSGLFDYETIDNISKWAIGYVEMSEELGLIEHGHFAAVGEKGLSLAGVAAANRGEAAEAVGRMVGFIANKAQNG
jgi:bacillolysin